MPVFEKNDPRSFTVCPSPGAAQLKSKQQSASGTLMGALKNVADLDIDNQLFNGMRTLTKISDVVSRTFGYDPFSGDGVNNVLGAMGISGGLITEVQNFNIGLVNRAIGQAKSIASKVRQGNLTLKQAPGLFQDFRSIIKIGNSLFNKRSSQSGPCVAGISPYAMDYDWFFPKYKFLFVAQFVFNDEYNIFRHNANTAAFLVHQFERPTIQFEYEDVNMYNYRTKVIKNTTYEPISFTMHDDSRNDTFDFIIQYIRSMSPIANQEDPTLFEVNSMNFDNLHNYESAEGGMEGYLDNMASNYTGSINPLKGGHHNILKAMNVYHLYDWGKKMNMYKFHNPKFTQIQQDQLDMAEGGTGSAITVQMAYDAVYMRSDIDVDNSSINISDLTDSGHYPLRYNDVSASASNPVKITTPTSGLDNIAGQAGDVLRNAAQAATDTANAVAETVKNATGDLFG